MTLSRRHMLALGASLPMAAPSLSLAQAKELRLGLITPVDHSWNKAALVLADKLMAATNGRLTMTVFHSGQLGNHVSTWIVRLPLGEPDPLARVEALHDQTAELKRSGASSAVALLMHAAEWMPASVLALGAGLARGPVNIIVTNVPGPPLRLYSVGAPLLGMYPGSTSS